MIDISHTPLSTIKYSFCSLVTRPDEYKRMVSLFKYKGFGDEDCEFLYLDNSKTNTCDAYSGYNRFLLTARGKYIVLCHQDIEPLEDGRDQLDQTLANLNQHDPTWALCGNAGVNSSGIIFARISDLWHADRNEGPFPAKVVSLDENFILVRRDANLALSRDVGGFHWYGSDICILANLLGWNTYVIDFHLKHNSRGNKDESFYETRNILIRKLNHAFRPRWHYSISWAPFYISDSLVLSSVAVGFSKIKNFCDRLTRRLKKRAVST